MLGSQRLHRCHLFATVAIGIIDSQTLFQTELCGIEWRNDDLIAFDRYPHALIDMEMCLPRHCCRQTNAQIVAPLFDIKDCFGHDLLLTQNV